MGPAIFISYSRRNLYLARQLKQDLQRCGCRPWMDEADIAPAQRWRDELRQAIDRCDYVFLLWSPEADESPNVLEECQYAGQQKPADRLWRLRIAGATTAMRPEYRELQDLDFTQGYWEGFSKLLRWLGVERPRPFNPFELLGSDMPVAEARQYFGDEEQQAWTVHAGPAAGGQPLTFVRLPLAANAYAMSWLVTRADATLRMEPEMQVLLRFTADRSAPDTVTQVLQHLVGLGHAPQMVMLEGPRDGRMYKLPNDKPHVWRDCVDLGYSTIERCRQQRRMHWFMHSPQALVFPLAARFHLQTSFCVYTLNLEPTADQGKYACVFCS